MNYTRPYKQWLTPEWKCDPGWRSHPGGGRPECPGSGDRRTQLWCHQTEAWAGHPPQPCFGTTAGTRYFGCD